MHLVFAIALGILFASFLSGLFELAGRALAILLDIGADQSETWRQDKF